MKKSEITQLTQIIEMLVTKEIRKQLPQLIGEIFTNIAGKSMVSENTRPSKKEVQLPSEPEHIEMKNSLRELFTGATPITRTELEEGLEPRNRPTIQYAKNPLLNKILNETTPDLKSRDRMTSMAAFQAGYSSPTNGGTSVMGAGPMMTESELPSFARESKKMSSVPQQQATPQVIRENHVPMSNIPDGISVLDVAKLGAGVIAAPVQEALTNYDRMKKIFDASKGRRY